MREFFESLGRRATIAGDQRAVITPERSLSYEELFDRVRIVAQWALRLPHRVGLLSGKSSEGIVSDLALSFAGKELIPLPAFFSDAQLSHIICTTQLSHAIVDPGMGDRAKKLGLVVCEPGVENTFSLEPTADAGRIIFTSGTTGQPKGVRLSGRQINASFAALAQATGANAADRYLSLLPSSLLLEQIAGIYVPLSVGAEIHLPRGSSGNSSPDSIAIAAEQANATATVLVPDLLTAWLRELRALGRSAPASLRYVAVGGAPVSRQLANAAWDLGVPVYEGYGLSECCSVVSLNRPGDRRTGTVGRPLPGLQVRIENSEIVVSGPTVMSGYLSESETIESWSTGDTGNFDSDGFLIVTGRKDNVIVTGSGRNINPEWVEETIAGDRRIKRCVVVEYESELVAIVIPDDASICRDWPAMQELVRHATREVPDYAKPRRYLAISDREFHRLDLLTANFRPRRGAIRRLVSDWSHFLSSQSI
jgi:long-subunit acyl-CoA synthetase (AMP-forming)